MHATIPKPSRTSSLAISVFPPRQAARIDHIPNKHPMRTFPASLAVHFSSSSKHGRAQPSALGAREMDPVLTVS